MKLHKFNYETMYEFTAFADSKNLFSPHAIAKDCVGVGQYWPVINRAKGHNYIVRQAYIRRCVPQVSQVLTATLDTPTVLLCVHGYALCWRPNHSYPIYAGCRRFVDVAAAINYWGLAESNPHWMESDNGFNNNSARKVRAAMFAANLHELRRKLAVPGATVNSVLEQYNVKA